MDLENKIWKSLEGGYKIPYDASIPLKRLQVTSDPVLINEILDDFWDNLHHQGDVGLASYLALPHLVEICSKKYNLGWSFIGLCLIIENQRHFETNPKLPVEFENYYFNGLKKMESYLLVNFKNITDPTAQRLALAFLATVNGQIKLGKAIEQLDDDILDEFLEQY